MIVNETVFIRDNLHVVIVRQSINEAILLAEFQRTRYHMGVADELTRLILPLDSVAGAFALLELLYELERLHRSNLIYSLQR